VDSAELGAGKETVAEDGTLWLPLSLDWKPLWRTLRSADLTAAAAASARAAEARAALPALASRLNVRYVAAAAAGLSLSSLLACTASLMQHPSRTPQPPPQPLGLGIEIVAGPPAEAPPGGWAAVSDPAWGVVYASGARSLILSATCSPETLHSFLATNGAACDAQREEGDALRLRQSELKALARVRMGMDVDVSGLLPEAAAVVAVERLVGAEAQLEKGRGLRLLLVADDSPLRYVVAETGALCVPIGFELEELIAMLLRE